jgi:hypothetical protein
VSSEDIPQLESVDQQARGLQSPDLVTTLSKDEQPLLPPRAIQTEL